MTHKLPGSAELPMLEGVSLSDLSDYDVDAGLERFSQTLAETPGPVVPPSATGQLGLSKLLPWGVAVIALGVGLGLATQSPPTTDPAPRVVDHEPIPATAPALVKTVPVASTPVLEPVETPEPAPARALSRRDAPPKARPKTKARARVATPPDEGEVDTRAQDPTLELQLAAQMRRSLDSDPARALELAQRGQREFPKGVFVKERLAHEALALAALGRTDEARRKAERFLKRYPTGPQSERVAKSVGPQ